MNKKNTIHWKNYIWELANDSEANVKIWKTLPPSKERNYIKNVNKFCVISSQALDVTKHVFPGLPDFTLEIAIFPKTDYRKNLSLAPEIPKWVQACVRDKKVCYEHTIANTWGYNLDTVPTEQKRELIHEFVHPVLAAIIGKNVLPLTVEEGLAETIPRIVLGYQKDIPSSTNYLINKLPNELIPPCEIDKNGMFKYSQKRLSANKAYMSSLVFTVGVAVTLDNDILQGINKILEHAKFSSHPSEYYQRLSQVTGLNQKELLEGKSMQLKGLAFISNKFGRRSLKNKIK